MANLAESLKKIRTARGFSQQKLAEKAGLSFYVITKIEQGQSHEPTIVSMMKLADALGVSLDDLVGREFPRRLKR